MVPAVIRVEAHDDYTLSVGFDNGEEGVLDMRPHLGAGVFRALADREQFRRVHVSFDTVAWDCGVDLDPEFVYAACTAGSRA